MTMIDIGASPSTLLLKDVAEESEEKRVPDCERRFDLGCSEAKLSDFIPGMVEEIARVLQIESGRVNVKATTTEGLGFAGDRKE